MRLLVHLLYNSSVFKGWNNVAVVHSDDAWGKGYVAEMESELRRSIEHTTPEAAADALPRTLLPFAFTNGERASVGRALDAVKNSGYSVIVVLTSGSGSSFAGLLEACLATPRRVHACT